MHFTQTVNDKFGAMIIPTIPSDNSNLITFIDFLNSCTSTITSFTMVQYIAYYVQSIVSMNVTPDIMDGFGLPNTFTEEGKRVLLLSTTSNSLADYIFEQSDLILFAKTAYISNIISAANKAFINDLNNCANANNITVSNIHLTTSVQTNAFISCIRTQVNSYAASMSALYSDGSIPFILTFINNINTCLFNGQNGQDGQNVNNTFTYGLHSSADPSIMLGFYTANKPNTLLPSRAAIMGPVELLLSTFLNGISSVALAGINNDSNWEMTTLLNTMIQWI